MALLSALTLSGFMQLLLQPSRSGSEGTLHLTEQDPAKRLHDVSVPDGLAADS